jgi:DNA-binding transcriptional LysR family regulator
MRYIFTIVNLSGIDLNLLLVLHTVLEEQSVAKAAKRLHVTPPAISNALARLRETLGDPLFVRSGRGLTPTPRALELAPVLARTLAELEQSLFAGPGFDPRTTTREFAIALADADQLARLPKLARVFADRLPRARLRVVSIDTLISAGGLADSAIDVAVGPATDDDGLHHLALYEEEGVLVVRRDHPRIRRRITPAQFGRERHVDIHLALGRAGIGNRVVTDEFARHGLVRDIAVTVPTFAAAAMVVASTDLVGGMPRRLAESLRSVAPIVIVRGPGPGVRFAMQMLWHERTHRDPAASYFRSLIAETFQS